MKIEVEIDEDKIYRMIVDKLYDTLLYNAKNQVEQAVRLELVGKIRTQAKEHLESILKDFTLPDGRTFRQYMEESRRARRGANVRRSSSSLTTTSTGRRTPSSTSSCSLT